MPEEFLPAATTAVEAARANIEWVEHFHAHLFRFFVEGSGAPKAIGLHVGAVLLFVLLGRLF